MNTHAENIATLEEMKSKVKTLIPLSQKVNPYQQEVIALKIYEFENYLNYCIQMEQMEQEENELNQEQIMMSKTAQA